MKTNNILLNTRSTSFIFTMCKDVFKLLLNAVFNFRRNNLKARELHLTENLEAISKIASKGLNKILIVIFDFFSLLNFQVIKKNKPVNQLFKDSLTSYRNCFDYRAEKLVW